MPRDVSNSFQTCKMKGKCIFIFHQYGIIGHAKIDYFNLENNVSNKSQNLEYKIN